VFYLDVAGSGVVSADLNTLAASIGTAWNTDLAPQVPSQVVLDEVAVVYVPSVGNEITGVSTTTHAGSNAGTILQDAAGSYVLNWLISAYYRGGHPRTYLPGVTSGNITNGSDVSASFASGLATAANSFRTAINALTTTNITGVEMGTVSFASGNAWRTTPQFRAYNGVTVGLKLGSQRRRIHS
jgi:hypothetical protein